MCDVDFMEEKISLVQKDAPAVLAVCVPINEEDQEDVTEGNKQQKIHRTANIESFEEEEGPAAHSHSGYDR